jgi:Ca2+-transporting ATPase
MAAVPEEIPVAFSSFMALGAYRLSKTGIISRHPVVIENLGAVSVIGLDKTGTITENRMEVRSMYDHSTGKESPPGSSEVLHFAYMASEENPFDEMEKAILKAYWDGSGERMESPSYEYPLEGHPPMMTHVFGGPEKFTAAAKGAPERIMQACRLDDSVQESLKKMIMAKASEGHRIIAVAGCHFQGDLPASQTDFPWEFKGLINLYDPPKKGVREVFEQIQAAGISIKLITGDYAQTAHNIATQVGIETGEKHVDGRTVMSQTMDELRKTVREHVLFARMYPEAKLRVIEALKLNGEIVGKFGTQIARQASDIILVDDDMRKVTEAIRQGRKIFSNLKKAIRYIISIHIPIILTASLPLLLGWKYPVLFTPIHVIFLELIMGPTCSIFFENEPEVPDLMKKPPRKRDIGLFTRQEMMISILQGLLITAGILTPYHLFSQDHSLEEVRSVVFTTLLISNIFLTFTNRSFSEPLYRSIRYKNNLAPVVLGISILFLLSIHYISNVRILFGMASINGNEILVCLFSSLLSVIWIEGFKIAGYVRKRRNINPQLRP